LAFSGVHVEILALLQQTPWLAISCTFVLSALVGSFLNVVIHRVPLMLEREWASQAAEFSSADNQQIAPSGSAASIDIDGKYERFNLITPRSRCPKCGHAITALENIPVISWLFLRGKCAGCKTSISARYPLIELLTAVLGAIAIAVYGISWAGLGAIFLTWTLITLTFIDVDTQLLPDDITLPLVWIGLIFNLWGVFAPLKDAVIGAMLGYMLLWSIFWLFKMITGKEGMGYGDFKLLAALGAWFGWQKIPSIILLSSVVGAIVGIGLMIAAKRGKEVPIPFGPYLAGAGLLTLYFSQQLGQLFGL
jgi:leader peptidase (prepilin peptidase) / N-methyltransferase